ncbi:unnamed protein product [Rotaria socialis]|uniref:Uncharacterized protein n=1 Tax=Rotaria socialis TaxID=392032 RepID=A0A817TQR3_9BILA|nr:unnamed protein product [Rotaria socialis]
MDPLAPNTQHRFFSVGSTYEQLTSNTKAETTHGRETNSTFQHIPSIKDRTGSSCNWRKTMVIVCIIFTIILVIAVIIIPIYVVRLIASETATASTTTAISLPSQCSNYTLDTDATRLTSYSATSSACDNSFSPGTRYCSKIYTSGTLFLEVAISQPISCICE